MPLSCHTAVAVFVLALSSLPSHAQTSPMTPDVPPKFTPPKTDYDYVKRVEMVPMRDGVKLYTVIVIPKGASHAPILLTRTPYNAAGRTSRSESPHMLDELSQGDDVFVKAGYIRVFQDVRGKYGSEGEYLMTRPVVGQLNQTKVDHTTDAYDTIDWLVKNVPESNGRVGMSGSSYEGFTVVMALLEPHPALKVAAPESPMYLVALKDHTIYATPAYWIEGDTLHYVTGQNMHNQVSLDLVDRELTSRLNRERSVDFRLPPARK